MKDLSIIIPAAGLGLRSTNTNPKILTKLNNNETILSRNLTFFKLFFPEAEVIIVVGFQYNKITKYLPDNIKVVYNPHFATNNVGYSLSLGIKNSLRSNVLIIYGDLVYNKKTLELLPISYLRSFILVDNNKLMHNEEVGIYEELGIIKEFAYNHNDKWCQIAFLNRKDKQIFLQETQNSYYIKKLFGFEILNKMIKKGSVFESVSIKEMKLIEMDSFKDLKKIKENWGDLE